jgi:hypothetical protein
MSEELLNCLYTLNTFVHLNIRLRQLWLYGEFLFLVQGLFKVVYLLDIE